MGGLNAYLAMKWVNDFDSVLSRANAQFADTNNGGMPKCRNV